MNHFLQIRRNNKLTLKKKKSFQVYTFNGVLYKGSVDMCIFLYIIIEYQINMIFHW